MLFSVRLPALSATLNDRVCIPSSSPAIGNLIEDTPSISVTIVPFISGNDFELSSMRVVAAPIAIDELHKPDSSGSIVAYRVVSLPTQSPSLKEG